MALWLRVFEVWLTARLLASPTFHRGVRAVHKKVHEIRHGKDPDEINRGTSIDDPEGENSAKRFMKHFADEIKEQFRGGPPAKK